MLIRRKGNYSLFRSFDLVLMPVDSVTTVFDPEMSVDVDGATIQLSPSDFLYHGYDRSEPVYIVYIVISAL